MVIGITRRSCGSLRHDAACAPKLRRYGNYALISNLDWSLFWPQILKSSKLD